MGLCVGNHFSQIGFAFSEEVIKIDEDSVVDVVCMDLHKLVIGWSGSLGHMRSRTS